LLGVKDANVLRKSEYSTIDGVFSYQLVVNVVSVGKDGLMGQA
jgi:hypothetical protein